MKRAQGHRQRERADIDLEVAAISLMIKKGAFATDPRMDAPGGLRLGPGDVWSGELLDQGMVCQIEMNQDRFMVALALRLDNLSDREWSSFEAVPVVVTALAEGALAWFLVDCSGMHMRAPVALFRDPAEMMMLRKLLERPDVERTITLFGVSRDRIRSVHLGIALDRIWRMLAEALDTATNMAPSDADLLAALRMMGEAPEPAMFAEAMRRHLLMTPSTE